ncbi:MAG: hypothetical protein FWB82_07395, partial [Treponema sp.]|nr:hypothetical protein [Treponema sp.]
KRLDELTPQEFKKFLDFYDESLYESLSVKACVASRSIPGGTAESAVLQAISKAKAFLAEADS